MAKTSYPGASPREAIPGWYLYVIFLAMPCEYIEMKLDPRRRFVHGSEEDLFPRGFNTFLLGTGADDFGRLLLLQGLQTDPPAHAIRRGIRKSHAQPSATRLYHDSRRVDCSDDDREHAAVNESRLARYC